MSTKSFSSLEKLAASVAQFTILLTYSKSRAPACYSFFASFFIMWKHLLIISINNKPYSVLSLFYIDSPFVSILHILETNKAFLVLLQPLLKQLRLYLCSQYFPPNLCTLTCRALSRFKVITVHFELKGFQGIQSSTAQTLVLSEPKSQWKWDRTQNSKWISESN